MKQTALFASDAIITLRMSQRSGSALFFRYLFFGGCGDA